MVIYDKNGAPVIGLDVDDASYRYLEIMGDSKVYLEFALTQHVELEIGSYVDFQGDRFTLMAMTDVTIHHNRNYEYKVTFYGPQARFSKYRVHNPVDGRLVFEMTAYPQEHLSVILANLNEREGAEVWTAGAVITGPQKTMTYNHTKLNDALTQIAQLYDTEWEVTAQKVIHLNKLEYNASDPLALGYGRNLGFKPGVGRTNYGETGQIERVYIQGGDRNISLKEYGNSTLLLPTGLSFKFDGEKFQYIHDGKVITETGFDADRAVEMKVDDSGRSVALATAGPACNEESLDLTDVYPKRVGTVSDVRYLYDHQYLTWSQIDALDLDDDEWLKVQVDIVDIGIPASLDFAECLIANDEPLTVIFQDGMLAGREFQATFVKAARTQATASSQSEERPANRFELVRANFNGIEMPNATFRPNVQDTYIVVNCCMPPAYIRDLETASGAEFDALRQAAKFLYQNKDVQLTFKGAIDDLFSKRNWLNVGGKLVLGGCVSFTHAQVQKEALVTRIVAIKDYINNPYTPEVTLSNESVKGGLTSRLSQMQGQTAHVLNQTYALERYARRSFRDAKETMEALENALLEGFSERISPIAVQTMQLLLGDESLQFRYVNAKTNPQQVSPGISYDPQTKKLTCNAGIIQHMTLGIDTLSNSHADSEYMFWDIARFESPYLGDDLSDKKFYLYAKCNKAEQGQTGYQVAEYVLSQTAIAMNSVSGYYHLLVGILNSESDDDRSFVTFFGFTEILPGRITTDKIVSSSGTTYWDLVQNILRLGDKLQYDPTNGLILRGALVQTGSGEDVVLGAWCGEFDYDRIYQLGDEVWWQAADGTISTYRYINALPANNHYPSDDNYWQFSAKGVKGADAESPVVADLDNEMDGVVVKSDGKTAARYTLTTNVTMWYGTLQLSLSQISFSGLPSGVTASGDTGTGAITFTIASGTTITTHEITITVKGVLGSVTFTRTVVFTIAGVKTGTDGDDGNDAVIYSLLPSVTVVKKNKNGVYSVANVSCKKMKRVGQNGIAETNEGTLKYTLDNGSSENTYSSAISTSSFSTCVTFLLYIGNTLVDRETVPMIIDGSDGTDGDNGDDGNGIRSITEDYARSLNGNTPPSSWQSSKPSQAAGYFIWTRTTIKFTDTSMSDFVSYQAVYCAQDGDDGDDGDPGAPGPATPYQGAYDANATYYATSKRCDIVYYPSTARWYMALYNGTDRSFSGKIPTNTAYWSDFGANFSNVATGLLFAAEAVIENAVVRKLRTAESGARVVANGNTLAMFDALNNLRLSITGDDLEDTPDDADYSINYQTVLDVTRTNAEVNAGTTINGHGAAMLRKGTTNVGTFTVENGVNKVIIPPLYATARLTVGAAGSSSGYMYWSGDLRFVIDGEIAVGTGSPGFDIEFSEGEGGSRETQVYVNGGEVSLDVGTHTLDLEWTTHANGSGWASDLYPTFMLILPSTSGMRVTYPSQVTAVGANGFRAMFSGSQKVEFINNNGTIEFMLRNGNYGIRIMSTGIQFTFNGGGNWYSASREYNSTLNGYFLKLT